jgi:cytochrome c peroxidase
MAQSQQTTSSQTIEGLGCLSSTACYNCHKSVDSRVSQPGALAAHSFPHVAVQKQSSDSKDKTWLHRSINREKMMERPEPLGNRPERMLPDEFWIYSYKVNIILRAQGKTRNKRHKK